MIDLFEYAAWTVTLAVALNSLGYRVNPKEWWDSYRNPPAVVESASPSPSLSISIDPEESTPKQTDDFWNPHTDDNQGEDQTDSGGRPPQGYEEPASADAGVTGQDE